MQRLLFVIVTLLLLGAALSGCKPKLDTAMYDRIAATSFGLKIAFDQSPAEVQAKLGQPQAEQKLQNGKVVEAYYLPVGVAGADRETPQLSCTYSDGKLIKLYNRFFPEDTDKPQPPYYMEILPGVKLGARKSDFVTTLGDPRDENTTVVWQFTGSDKRMISILARFINVEGVGDQLCCMLQIVRSPIMEEPRGEDLESPEVAGPQGKASGPEIPVKP